MSARTLRFTISLLLFPAWMATPSRAADNAIATDSVLVTLESRADNASARDRAFLYTDLLRRLAEVEGALIEDGDSDKAQTVLKHMEDIAAKLRAAETKDSRRLKSAEELMERTTERLHDMLHLASDDQRAAMKSTLDHLNRLHDEMLALVFAQ